MKKKTSLIFGITGQDGAYLARFLLSKNYIVHGIKRRSSSFNTARIDHLYKDPKETKTNFFLHYGDLTDATNLIRLLKEIRKGNLKQEDLKVFYVDKDKEGSKIIEMEISDEGELISQWPEGFFSTELDEMMD